MTFGKLTCLLMVICLVWPQALSAQMITREDEYGVSRIYQGSEIRELRREEAKRIRKVAEEFAEKLIAKDEEELFELCYYEGFESEKKKKILELIDEYHEREGGLTLLSVEARTAKTNEKVDEAKVIVVLQFSMGEGLMAPSLEKWKFVYKVNKWLFPLEP